MKREDIAMQNVMTMPHVKAHDADPAAQDSVMAPDSALPLPEPRSRSERDSRSRGSSPSAALPRSRSAPASSVHSPFLPMLLGGLAIAGWLGFQAYQGVVERDALQLAHAQQQQAVDSAAKLRSSLDALAADTQRLATAGNPNARLLVDELRKRGVTINPSGDAAAAAATTPATR